MGCTIHILDAATGVTRTVAEDRDWLDDDSGCEFHWTEGGYSADCNRALHFARSAGEPDPEDRFGTRDRYVLTHITLENGERIEVEEAPQAA